ncbi:vanadium-dependent haloperoxidase [Adhaeribacter aquaticus]|uniref:vanadium-dependent haloperoxidase n=1 Tax=Adhaeribacter aquaticus TaxID=299567 RepID=UPI000401A61D|nr:vanadium-dependent haloperoxidase [Adhaeribacter aquaticus]
MKQIKLCLFFLLLVCIAQAKPKPIAYPADAQTYVQTLKKLTDVMVIDVTGPCAASRYYAYANLAAYEILHQQVRPDNFLSFHPTLRDFPDISVVKAEQPIDANFACLYALLRIGEELLPSGHLLVPHRNQLMLEASKKYHLNKEKVQASANYADEVIKNFLLYVAKDGYLKTTGYLRYTPLKEARNWRPTPPAYQESYEPYWGTLRPFMLDSAAQFKPAPPVPFNEKSETPFYNLAQEVFNVTSSLTVEQKQIANFWDCNPFFLVQQGHISYGTKKISPGGHWMGITGIACMQKKLSLAETVRWHTLAGITMADAFISCWNEKFRSNRVRPETFINKYIERNWRPLLQTPPFPEYTSGHSVVSAAVANLLTALAGENFTYTDTVEMEFGLPARSFSSFRQAAQEAAISRLYGGIHFRDAIDNGYKQGEQISFYILQKLKLTQ